MSNEVYGKWEFAISLGELSAINEHEAIAEAESKLNRYSEVTDRIKKFVEKECSELGIDLTIHNNEIVWEDYFSEDES